MTILDMVKTKVSEFLMPKNNYAGSNAAVLDQLFDASAKVEMLRGSWHPRHSAGSGARVQWEHFCKCGDSHTLLESEKYKNYSCGRCKKLLDFAGDTGVRLSRNKEMRAAMLKKLAQFDFVEADWSLHGEDGDYLPEDKREILFSTLKALPARERSTSGPRILDTWDNSPDGDVTYSQSNPGGFF